MDAPSTRVPALLDALYARLSAALPDWQGFDGPPAGDDIELDLFVIGHPDFDGTAVVSDVQRTPGMGSGRYTETHEVRCVVSSLSGDLPMKARRDRVHAALDTIEDALHQDVGLGGVVDEVMLGPSMSWAQTQSPDGAACEVAFSILARVTR